MQQYGSGGMSGYPNQPLQYPAGPQQRCAPSPSYPSSRMPLMGQYSSASHNQAQLPPGAGQPNPPQYYKVVNPLPLPFQNKSHTDAGATSGFSTWKTQLIFIFNWKRMYKKFQEKLRRFYKICVGGNICFRMKSEIYPFTLFKSVGVKALHWLFYPWKYVLK